MFQGRRLRPADFQSQPYAQEQNHRLPTPSQQTRRALASGRDEPISRSIHLFSPFSAPAFTGAPGVVFLF
jgi:hypothetical protein